MKEHRLSFRILSQLAFAFALFVALVLAPAPARAQAGACTSGPCVTTYHNDPMRDGVNSQETTLSPALFPAKGAVNFGLLVPAAGGATGAVDGLIYAQPLYLSGVTMASSACSGSQNIVLVATMNNSIYAFTWTYTLSSKSYSFLLTQCWMLNLNQAGEYATPFTVLGVVHNGVPCNNSAPQIGIASTPVIDTSVTPPILYAVSAHQTASMTYTYRLHAINVSTGTEQLNGSSAPYDLSGVFHSPITAVNQMQRPALALYNASPGTANVYVSFGSFCDVNPYSGYVAALTYNYSSQTFSPVSGNWIFDTQGGATQNQGGIWMGGSGPAVDTSGNVYVAVANGTWNGATTFGESVVQLATTSSGLTPVDFYTPNDYADLNGPPASTTVCSTYQTSSCPSTNQLTITRRGDVDLGSGGVTLISPVGIAPSICGTNSQLVAGGKEGVVYDICYNPLAGSTPQTVMGGLDGCGYDCSTPSNASLSACTESFTPGNGAIAQCFQGVNSGENQKNGSNNIYAGPGIRGTEAFWAGSPANPQNYLYASGAVDPLIAYQINPATGLFNVVGSPDSFPANYPYPGTIPSISWNGSNPDTALLWAINSGGFGQWPGGSGSATAAKPAILTVYNAIPSGSPSALQKLWESAMGTDNTGPAAVKYTVPTVAGGLVFVPGGAPGYAPGPPGGSGVNCTAAALANSTTPTVCGGMLSIYGKVHE
jgi:hypothetical protein